jgi:hypothetical protein
MLEHSTPTPTSLESAAAADTPGARESLPRARLCLDAALRLWLVRDGTRVRVKPVRCFPWSAPGELVSLRNEQDGEELLVTSLSELDAEGARALAVALDGAGFVLEVERIDSIEEDYEMRIWRAETRHGKRTFQTKLDEWPWATPDGGHLVRDLAGDLFRIPPLETLDEKSQKWLWAYVG